MRLFFIGPRLFGIRPGISVNPRDLKKLVSSGTASSAGSITGGFVYVLKNKSGQHKIGSSVDPIQRINQLQTGSAEPLDFAWVGVSPEGAYTRIERYAHTLLEAQKIPGAGDEWFAVPASIAIGAVHEAAMRLGDPIQQVQPGMVPQILAVAAQAARLEARPDVGKYCGILNPLPRYIRWPLTALFSLIIGIAAAGIVFVIAAMIQSGS
jgi:hypothetical protein